MAATRTSKRAGRGSKMQGLLDTEHLMQPVQVDSFWDEGEGAALWKDADRDLDDNEFDAQKEVEEDSIDEDFDEPEDPNLDTEVLGSDFEEKKVKKKHVYVDPKKRERAAKKAAEADTKKRPRSQAEAPQEIQPEPKRIRREPVDRTDRSLRQKTVNYTKERVAAREKQKEIQENNPRKPRKKPAKPDPSQAELLEEATQTEIWNTHSLAEMKRLELIKKKPVPQRPKIVGPKEVTLYSKTGLIYVAFEEELPKLLYPTQNQQTQHYPQQTMTIPPNATIVNLLPPTHEVK